MSRDPIGSNKNSTLKSSCFCVVSLCSNHTSNWDFSISILYLFCPNYLKCVNPCCISTSFCFTLMSSCLIPVSFLSIATSSWCNLTVVLLYSSFLLFCPIFISCDILVVSSSILVFCFLLFVVVAPNPVTFYTGWYTVN